MNVEEQEKRLLDYKWHERRYSKDTCYILSTQGTEEPAINDDMATSSAPYRYLLANDINASGVDFQSLGNSTVFFDGTFDGLGYKISNLKNTTNGLFSYFSGNLRNLGLVNANISGASGLYVGGIAGLFSGSMSNTYVTGNITGTLAAGGLVGHLGPGLGSESGKVPEIRNSHNKATIKNNSSYAGGIVGTLTDSSLYNVYNTGSVTGDGYATTGGIVGEAWLSGGYFDGNHKECRLLTVYNTGNVTGYDYIGGIAGNTIITVGDAYNWGTITRKSSIGQIGGIDGRGDKFWMGGMEWTSKVTGKPFNNYFYYSRNISRGGGIYVSSLAELTSIFEANQKSNVATVGVTTPFIPTDPIIPTVPVDESGTSSGGGSDSAWDGSSGESGGGGSAWSGSSGGSNGSGGSTGSSSSGISSDLGNSGGGGDGKIKLDKETSGNQVISINPGHFHESEIAIARTGHDGLYIFNIDTTKENLTMDIYNTIDAFGVVEYYDKDGKYIGGEILERNPTAIASPLDWLYKALYVFGKSDGVKYARIKAPTETAHIRVTNSIYESNLLAVYVTTHFFLDQLSKLADITIDSKLSADYAENVVKKLGKSIGDHVLFETPAQLIKVLNNMPIQDLANLMVESIAELGLDISFNILQVLFESAGNPAGDGFAAIKAVGNAEDAISNTIMQERATATKPIDIYITNEDLTSSGGGR